MLLGRCAQASMQGFGQIFEREGLGNPSSRQLGVEPLWIHSGCASPVVLGVALGKLWAMTLL